MPRPSPAARLVLPMPTTPRPALLLIDVQNGIHTPNPYYGGSHSNSSLPTAISTLLSLFRAWASIGPPGSPATAPLVLHVRHHEPNPLSPLHPSPENAGVQFTDFALPVEGEEVFTKNVNSAFIGTALESYLRSNAVGTLFVAGLATDHCVSTSVRMASNLKVTRGEWGEGRVVLVADAVGAHAKGEWSGDVVHAVHVESLKEFAEVWTVEDVRKWVEGERERERGGEGN